jgi:hypothetical protein
LGIDLFILASNYNIYFSFYVYVSPYTCILKQKEEEEESTINIDNNGASNNTTSTVPNLDGSNVYLLAIICFDYS